MNDHQLCMAAQLKKYKHAIYTCFHQIRAEIGILQQLNHPNILRFIGACLRLPNVCLVTEVPLSEYKIIFTILNSTIKEYTRTRMHTLIYIPSILPCANLIHVRAHTMQTRGEQAHTHPSTKAHCITYDFEHAYREKTGYLFVSLHCLVLQQGLAARRVI